MGYLIAYSTVAVAWAAHTWWLSAAAALAGPAMYAGSCWWFPFANCWCCKGAGRHRRKDGKVLRDCRICKGTGKRLRIGRRIWNRYKKARG